MAAGRELFARMMRLPDDDIDLGLAALLIAEEEYPELDREPYLRRLDSLGAEARARIEPDMHPRRAVEALRRLLAEEQGFTGNRDDYYDPRNSFLNDVLDRRLGIPISLSVLYMEVGRRAGLRVYGVGFPAHFLARYADVVFDPFNGGRVLSEDDCRRLLADISGGEIAFRPAYLDATPAKQIVTRMLNNLKRGYLEARYYHKALGIIDRLLMVDPTAYGELRDRGAVHAELKQYARAKADLEAYLQHCRDPRQAEAVREALRNIENILLLMDE